MFGSSLTELFSWLRGISIETGEVMLGFLADAAPDDPTNFKSSVLNYGFEKISSTARSVD